MSRSQIREQSENFKDPGALLAEIARVDAVIDAMAALIARQPAPPPGPERFAQAANRAMLRFTESYRSRLARGL
jgi:hypothetical protein